MFFVGFLGFFYVFFVGFLGFFNDVQGISLKDLVNWLGFQSDFTFSLSL